MQAKCTHLLTAVSGAVYQGESNTLVHIVACHRTDDGKDKGFNLEELLGFLPRKQHEEFAAGLLRQAEDALLRVSRGQAMRKNTDVRGAHENMEKDGNAGDVKVVEAVAVIVGILLKDKKSPTTELLVDIVVMLHDCLMKVGATWLKNMISRICEMFWIEDRPKKTMVISNMMCYLLVRALGDEKIQGEGAYEEMDSRGSGGRKQNVRGSITDVRRLVAVKGALNCLDLSPRGGDEAGVNARNLVLRCSTSGLFLRTDEGQRFLAHSLTLPDLSSAVHSSMLSTLAHIRKSRAVSYGNVYFYAWKSQCSQPAVLSSPMVPEEASVRMAKSNRVMSILDDICLKAVHAATEPLATNLRTILSSFHCNKRVRGVDAMLKKLYGPILFRSLSVANSFVRRNALYILADAFPVHSPDDLLPEIQADLDRQLNFLQELLMDPAPIVRVAAVSASARVCGLLWELIPGHTAKRFAEILTRDLAFDASSSAVRAEVCIGLKFMFDNHFTHNVLSVVLPQLRVLIEDSSERVRLGFLDFLITVRDKRVQSCKYFDVVKVEHLLQRLTVETPACVSKLLDLLVPTYFPLKRKHKSEKDLEGIRFRACSSLIKANPEAARKFYENIYLHVPPGPLCRLARYLARESYSWASYSHNSQDTSLHRKIGPSEAEHMADDHNSHNEQENKKDERNLDLFRNDPEEEIFTKFSICASILSSVSPSLKKESNSSLLAFTMRFLETGSFVRLLGEGAPMPVRTSAWKIVSSLPPSSNLSQSCRKLWVASLRSVPEHLEDTEFLDAVVQMAFHCGELEKLIGVFEDWQEGNCIATGGPPFKKKKRCSGKATNADLESLKSSRRAIRVLAKSILTVAQKVKHKNEWKDEDAYPLIQTMRSVVVEMYDKHADEAELETLISVAQLMAVCDSEDEFVALMEWAGRTCTGTRTPGVRETVMSIAADLVALGKAEGATERFVRRVQEDAKYRTSLRFWSDALRAAYFIICDTDKLIATTGGRTESPHGDLSDLLSVVTRGLFQCDTSTESDTKEIVTIVAIFSDILTFALSTDAFREVGVLQGDNKKINSILPVVCKALENVFDDESAIEDKNIFAVVVISTIVQKDSELMGRLMKYLGENWPAEKKLSFRRLCKAIVEEIEKLENPNSALAVKQLCLSFIIDPRRDTMGYDRLMVDTPSMQVSSRKHTVEAT